MAAPQITSRHNPLIKGVIRLRDRQERDRRDVFLIDGLREIRRASSSGVEFLQVYVSQSVIDAEGARYAGAAQLQYELSRAGARIISVSDDVFRRMAYGDRDEGMVVVARTQPKTLADLRLTASPFLAVIEGVEKPGNLGAILRSADAAGVDGVVLADGQTDLWNPNTIRASLGTVFRPNVCVSTSQETFAWLQHQGVPIYAALPESSVRIWEVDLRGGGALVLGSESCGLSSVWRCAEVTPVSLPMCGIADSLNVSATAAVMFYEAFRQRACGGS